MITCPACGKENEDSAVECRRCRAPLREEAAAASSAAFGEVCRRCEAYNEPGATVCSNCGLQLLAGEQGGEPPLDKTPEQPYAGGSVSDEMSAFALSAEEAAEAGGSARNGDPSLDRTPADPYAPPAQARGAAPAPGVAPRKAEPAPPPPPAAAPARAQAAEPAAAEKNCKSCGAANPPAAKFCFDCGTPFIKRPEPPRAPPTAEPVKSEPPPSIHVDADLIAEEAASEAPPAVEEQVADWPSAEPAEEAPPPFQASLVVEKGSAPGTAFALARLENSVGASGAQIELGEDAFVAPHAATLLFAEDHLVVRDEGSANGIFVKVRESAPLEPGDLFIAGERLLRYEGACELPRESESDTPFLGAPRPAGPVAVRVSEVLAGGKTGRTCHRSGPVIAVGRSGCDLNFPSDSSLAARHAEIRLAEDGSATLADLGQAPTGVFLRVRPQATMDLQAGDIVQIGEQQLRLELG